MPNPLRTLVRAGGALALLVAAATPALAGPPWISVEYPANPLDQETRGALLTVRTYHHADAIRVPLTGTAEGLVDGRRQSIPLRIAPTARSGAFAVRGEIPARGSWVLVLTMMQGDAPATALVALGPGREVTSIRVPHTLRDGWVIPRAHTAGDVERMLQLSLAFGRAQQSLSAADAPAGDGSEPLLAGLGLLALVPLGALARRLWR